MQKHPALILRCGALMRPIDNRIKIYTDGACTGNPGPGGFGVVLLSGSTRKELSGSFFDTTNNRMELYAVIAGLEALKRPCTVELYSDSAYVVNSVSKGWVYDWQQRGWRRKDRKPTPNVDLWERLLPLLEKHDVSFKWVKGHADNPHNNRCDFLATQAILKGAKLVNKNEHDVFVVFDLEATCWETDRSTFRETIEIGAVCLDANNNELGTFQTFIRPTISPELSAFCVGLTSISQSDVNDAPDFSKATEDFCEWIAQYTAKPTMVSWGAYDKNQFLREMVLKQPNIRLERFLQQHINLKELFSELYNMPPCGMQKALKRLGVTLSGTHHRGIDDAKNIAEIFKRITKNKDGGYRYDHRT